MPFDATTPDFYSVMHAARTAYAIRNEEGKAIGDVIEILDDAVSQEILATGYDVGKHGLSKRDAVQLQLMYVSKMCIHLYM
jgi:hypothetical protein